MGDQGVMLRDFTAESLRELWLLDDGILLRRVKLDLAPQAFLSLARVLVPEDRSRLGFIAKLLVSSVQSAPATVYEYLQLFRDRLYDLICVKLDYCGNKK